MFPESYSAPAGWYGGKYPIKMKLEVFKITLEHLQMYYTELLSDYPDVLTTQVVSEITGYGKTSINNWCGKGHLKAFKYGNSNRIRRCTSSSFCALPIAVLSLGNRIGILRH